MIERNLIVRPLPQIKHPGLILRVPEGGYCHATCKKVLPEGLRIRLVYCPFWYGDRPNGGCLLYGKNAWSEDAIKICTTKADLAEQSAQACLD